MANTYEPLYLKYRPQSLGDLVGQKSVVNTLTNAIEHKRVAHAYLFTGPRGCGKTSSARIMAKSLNCQQGPTAKPCLECTSCLEVKLVNSPSVIEIDAASHNSVDDARLLIERAPLVTVGGNYKIYIIDECHMLTKEAFNALLKTIEEPPPNVIFILATTEEHKVPPTIISRCQRLMFKLINHDELAVYLREVATKEEINIDDAAIDLIARRSGGGLRDALGLLDQASLLATSEKQVHLDDLLVLLGSVKEDVLLNLSKAIQEGAAEPVLQCAGSLLGEGREPALIALELSKHFLNLAKAQLQIPVLGSPSYLEALSAQSKLFDRVELAQLIEQLSALEQTCRRSSQSALSLEIGLLSLCHRLEITELKSLKEKVSDLESRLASGAPLQAMPPPRPPRPAQAPAPSHAPAPPAPSHTAAHVSHAATAHASPPVSSPAHQATASMVSQAAEAAHEPANIQQAAAVLTEENISEAQPQSIEPDSIITYEEEPDVSAPAEFSEFTEIDEVWSAILDQLQERHKPTYSLLQSMCTPLTLTRDELVIGVKEMLLKTLEGKIDHIRAAAAATGRDLQVKIKPVTGAQEIKPKPRASSTGGAQGKPEHRAEPVERASASAQASAAQSQTAKPAREHVPLSAAAPAKAPNPEPQEKGALVKEAYKLFEGPGSREFSDNS
ncbi:MAG: DNA polymerase III subunit gamma/tau [Candidatus Melainabacteria bacterium]|nr:DNA polymerase III subunit gamma/tau [Candidatus Melainabacteria bacterium]